MSRSLTLLAAVLGLALAVLLARCAPSPPPDPRDTPAPPGAAAPSQEVSPAPERTAPTLSPDSTTLSASCAEPVRFVSAAVENRANLERMSWAPFGRNERGWATYAPFVGQVVGTACPPDSPAFAHALSRWAERNGLRGDGVLDGADFQQMKTAAHALRPFVRIRGEGVCPGAPPESRLVTAGPTEGYKGKAVQMRPAVLAAYRRMVADAKREEPAIARDPDMLDIFSAYRSPAYDAARCARDGNCDGRVRASCSPHRTGLALDIVVGAAPGFGVDSTADENRRAMSQTPAYRWLVKNARRYGFVNYVFEPWHWEYVEEPV